MNILPLLALLALAAVTPIAHAQNPPKMEQSAPAAIVNNAPRPHLRVPRAQIIPRMDGSPDDPAWRNAAQIDGLTLSLGPQARNLEVPCTRVKLLWTPQRLFVRFIAEDDEIYSPFGSQRDATHFRGDACEIFIDPVGDGQQWVEIQISPDNGIFDKLFLVTAPNQQTNADGTYAAATGRNVWEFDTWQVDDLQSATGRFQTVNSRGWIADLSLPAAPLLKRLGRKEFAPMTLRANLLRYEWPQDAKGERSLNSTNWAPVIWGKPHRSPAAMGFLELVEKQ